MIKPCATTPSSIYILLQSPSKESPVSANKSFSSYFFKEFLAPYSPWNHLNSNWRLRKWYTVSHTQSFHPLHWLPTDIICHTSCCCCSEHSLHNAHTLSVCTSDWCQQPKFLLLSIPRLSADWKDTSPFYALSPYIFSAMYYRSSMTDCLYISLPVHPSVVCLTYTTWGRWNISDLFLFPNEYYCCFKFLNIKSL